jgi:hypothetical protein
VQGHNPRFHYWAELEKKFVTLMEQLAPAFKEVEKAPLTKVLGDASESTFAFYWSAGGRSHRGFQAVIAPCHDNCTKGPSTPESIGACMSKNCYPAALEADKMVRICQGRDAGCFKHLVLEGSSVLHAEYFTPTSCCAKSAVMYQLRFL